MNRVHRAKTLLARLDGGSSTIVLTPDTRSPLNELYGCSCATSIPATPSVFRAQTVLRQLSLRRVEQSTVPRIDCPYS